MFWAGSLGGGGGTEQPTEALRGQRRGTRGERTLGMMPTRRNPGLTWQGRWPESGEGHEDQEIRQFGSLAYSTLFPPLNPEPVT